MTYEFVTLPREVVEQALEALFEADSVREDYQNVKMRRDSIAVLRAALKQPQIQSGGIPPNWKLVPVEPTIRKMAAMGPVIRACYNMDGVSENVVDVYRAMLAAAPQPPALEQPQAEQPAMTPIAQRKLDSLLAEGYTISGYSVYHERKHQHGFVTGAGLVGWWKPEGMEYPQPQGEREPVAWINYSTLTGERKLGWECESELASDPLYAKPQPPTDQQPYLWYDAERDSIWNQEDAKYMDMSGTIPLYTHPQPKRKPLTDMQKMMCWSRATHDADVWHKTEHQCLMDYGAEIEAAHNIK